MLRSFQGVRQCSQLTFQQKPSSSHRQPLMHLLHDPLQLQYRWAGLRLPMSIGQHSCQVWLTAEFP